MKILCDTCCILLVVRIAPNMFIDNMYGCFTIREVRDEIFKKQKFKSRYPWRVNYKDKIKAKSFGPEIRDDFRLNNKVINGKIESYTINKRKNRIFDLSYTDQKIVAYALASKSTISTNDENMQDFTEQEFDEKCISSLALVNEWIRNGLITWGDQFQTIIEDWDKNNEPVQPKGDIEEFESLTGNKYVGP